MPSRSVMRQRADADRLLALGGKAADDALPNGPSLIGKRIPRPDVRRLLRGRGRYVGDINLPRMLHLAVRALPACARADCLDRRRGSEAGSRRCPGGTGADVAAHCKQFIADGVAHNRPGHKVPPQHVDGGRRWPIIRGSRWWRWWPPFAREAEDAAELVDDPWEPLPAILDGESALRPQPDS